MEGRSEVRRLPRGERCSHCGDRKYYLENGMRFCASNGHEIEGFVQFDIGDEEDSGRLGVVAKRDKEIKEREKKQLTGLEGKTLFLEALQLVLRSQLLWLIHEKGHKEELETVVRDLWDLRIRAFSSLVPEENAGGTEPELFSSQPLSDDAMGEDRPKAQSLSWDPERGSDWPMPRILETLSLCYLGCLLLRIPTRIGELHRWANGGNIPYKQVYHDLPQEMQDRMPSQYTRVLKLPLHTPLKGGDLHRSVMHLAFGYYYNYQMLFPNLNSVPMLLQYAKDLLLPIETVRTAHALSAALTCAFQFPTSKSRIFPVDHPEILLAALMIVATKLIFPFQGNQLSPLGLETVSALRFNWQRWTEAQKDTDSFLPSPKDCFQDMSADQVVSMDEDQLENYFSHVSSLVDNKIKNEITPFFPLEPLPSPEPPVAEASDGEVDERAREVLTTITGMPHAGSNQEDSPEDRTAVYETFRTVEDLPATAKKLYATTANVASLRLETLLRAVYMVEQRIIVWQRQRRHL